MKDESPTRARAAVEQLSQNVRAALLVFMESRRKESPAGARLLRGPSHEIRSSSRSTFVSTSLRTIRNTNGVAYQAQLRIKHLRIQTRILRELEKAVLYQTILAQVGDAIAQAGCAIWDAPDKFCLTV